MRPEDYSTALFHAIREKIRARILEEIEADLSAAVETVQVVLRDARAR
jgi:hypothetical protein